MKTFPNLEDVNVPLIPTIQASFYLRRSPSTLRTYGRSANAPIKAVKVGSQYLFRTADIKNLLNGTGETA